MPEAARSSTTDVLVVGAGPAGLLLALALRHHGAHCTVADQTPAPSPACRATGVQVRTMEIWERLGLVAEAIDAGVWLRGARLFINGQPAGVTVFDLARDLPDVPYGKLFLPEYETERILAEHLDHCGVDVRRSTPLLDVREQEDGIVATLGEPDGTTETVKARYLVGCDGAHSTVRHHLGLGFEGVADPATYMVADVELDGALERGVVYSFLHVADGTTDDSLICYPLPGHRRWTLFALAPADRVGAQPAGEDLHTMLLQLPPPTRGDLEPVVERLAPGTKLGELHWTSYFRVSYRAVPRYRLGRVFLAGDAAHLNSPTGGQGMNTGMQDAYNLAWKLALDLQGRARPDLLDSYEAERRPVGQETVARIQARDLAQLHGHPLGGHDVFLADAEILVNYRDSAWVGQDLAQLAAGADGPQPGDRAPDVGGLHREGVAFPLRLFELLSPTRHTLLLYAEGPLADDERAELARVVACAQERTHGHIAVYALVGADVALQDERLWGFNCLQDAEGRYRAAYGLGDRSLYLIRPDGYVGYRASPIRANLLEAYLARIFGA
jgi:2-polyprenyl-6-methoxyphenol hydroxylase-like FAD-dependent oxidoreductase